MTMTRNERLAKIRDLSRRLARLRAEDRADRRPRRPTTAELRDGVWAEAEARGQVAPGFAGRGDPAFVLCCFHEEVWDRRDRPLATELMHMEGGVGRRQQRQSLENCGAGCWQCNLEWDRKPSHRPAMAARWAKRMARPIPPGVLRAAALRGWEVPA